MVSWRRAVLFGLAIWLIPFGVAFSLDRVRESWRALFESIMPVVVALVAVIFAVLYFRQVRTAHVREGLLLGMLWLAISIVIDLPLMLSPPMNMSIVEYMADIGLAYLIMPIITTGIGAALARSRQAVP